MGRHTQAFAEHHRCRRWTKGEPLRRCPLGHSKKKEKQDDQKDREEPDKEQEQEEEADVGIGEGTGVPRKVKPNELYQGAEAGPETAGVRAKPLDVISEGVAKISLSEPAQVRQTVAVSKTRINQLQEAHNEDQGIRRGQANFGQQGLHNESQGVPARQNIGRPTSPRLARFLTAVVVRNMAIRDAVINTTPKANVAVVEAAVAQAETEARLETSKAQSFQLEEAKAAVRSQKLSRLRPAIANKAFKNTSAKFSPIRAAENIRVVTKGGGVKGVTGGSGRGRGGKKIKQPRVAVAPVRKQVAKGRIVETDSGPIWVMEDERRGLGRAFGSQGELVYGPQ